METNFIRQLKTGKQKIAVVGLGYVGINLITNLCDEGFDVIGIDKDQVRVDELTNGIDRTKEIGIKRAKDFSKHIPYTTDTSKVSDCGVIILCIQTPVNIETKKPELQHLQKACMEVGKYLTRNTLVILESSVTPGTTFWCKDILESYSRLNCNLDFLIGYSPERTMPGTDKNFTKIIASDNDLAIKIMEIIYKPVFGVTHACGIKEAEAAKLFENIQKDVNIALMNYIVLYSHRKSIDPHMIIDAMNSRIDHLNYLPGLVGGHCIPVDGYYLDFDFEPNLIKNARDINDYLLDHILINLQRLMPINKGRKIGILGVTYKPNVPDLRNSKILDLIFVLKECGYYLTINDPVVDKLDFWVESGFEPKREEIISEIDVLVYAVDHKAYEFLDVNYLLAKNPKVLIDLTGRFYKDKTKIENKGVAFWCI